MNEHPEIPEPYPCDGVKRFRIKGSQTFTYSQCYEFLLGMYQAECEAAKKLGRQMSGANRTLDRMRNLNHQYENIRLNLLRHEHSGT